MEIYFDRFRSIANDIPLTEGRRYEVVELDKNVAGYYQWAKFSNDEGEWVWANLGPAWEYCHMHSEWRVAL